MRRAQEGAWGRVLDLLLAASPPLLVQSADPSADRSSRAVLPVCSSSQRPHSPWHVTRDWRCQLTVPQAYGRSGDLGDDIGAGIAEATALMSSSRPNGLSSILPQGAP